LLTFLKTTYKYAPQQYTLMRKSEEKMITVHGEKMKARVPRRLSSHEREKVMIELFDALKKVAEGKRNQKAV
jgi:hypothetical protein